MSMFAPVTRLLTSCRNEIINIFEYNYVQNISWGLFIVYPNFHLNPSFRTENI